MPNANNVCVVTTDSVWLATYYVNSALERLKGEFKSVKQAIHDASLEPIYPFVEHWFRKISSQYFIDCLRFSFLSLPINLFDSE